MNIYFLKWNYQMGNIGRCEVEYEKEPYLNVNYLKSEERKVAKLQKIADVYNRIAARIDREGFPDLSPADYKISQDEYPWHHLAEYSYQGITDLDCNLIVGDNWCNIPKELVSGSYPKPRKVASILRGYLNLNEESKNTKKTMAPIPVEKILDHYFCGEGNHRLYVARLLGLKTVKVEIWEYNYLSLLKKCKIIESPYLCLGIQKEQGLYTLYDISVAQKQNILRLMHKHGLC